MSDYYDHFGHCKTFDECDKNTLDYLYIFENIEHIGSLPHQISLGHGFRNHVPLIFQNYFIVTHSVLLCVSHYYIQ